MVERSMQFPDSSPVTHSQFRDSIGNAKTLFDAELRALEVRVDGLDRASSLFQENLTRVPTDVDKQVGHLKQLHDVQLANLTSTFEMFRARIDRQFVEWETRGEVYAQNRRTVVAAEFAAQKELIGARFAAGQEAVAKAEVATRDQIKALAELRASEANATNTKFADLTSRLDRGEGANKGQKESRNDRRLDLGSVTGLVGVGLLAMSLLGGFIGYMTGHANNPAPAPAPYFGQYAPPPQQYPTPPPPPPPQVSVVPVVPVPIPR